MSVAGPTPKKTRYTIDADTAAWLEARGEITPPTEDGYRTISDAAYSSFSSSSDSTSEIPVFADSPQTLEMGGFSAEAAREVFALYERLSEEYQGLGLVQVACDWIDAKASHRNACRPNDDYEAAWLSMGVNPDLLERLLADEHRTMRLMQSASSEFKESVRETADYVNSLAKNVKRRKERLEARS